MNLPWKMWRQLKSLTQRVETLEQNVRSLNQITSRLECLSLTSDPHESEKRLVLMRHFVQNLQENIKVKRFGRHGDGGYYMAEPIYKHDVLISAGLADDVSFEEDLSTKLELIIGLDHTIPPLSTRMLNFKHLNVGLGVEGQRGFMTIPKLIENYPGRDYLLKIDIEGDEWNVLDETDPNVLKCFRQIVIEFHGFTQKLPNEKYDQMVRVLEKMNLHHSLLFVHANNNGEYRFFGSLKVPDVIEVTYIRHGEDYIPNIGNFSSFDLASQNSETLRPISRDWKSSIL